MLIVHSEKNDLHFDGTIIDLETIGKFCRYYDSRDYQNLEMIIFGYINKQKVKIFCAEGKEAIPELIKRSIELLDKLQRPFLAYNCCFEMGVFYHSCGLRIEFDGELMKEKVKGIKWENKREACAELSVSNHGDPFNGFGRKCSEAWLNENYEDTIRHNRSCLLSERDILLKRGHRKPDHFIFYTP